MSERGEAQFRSSVSGLWYDKPVAAGNIDALRVGDGILDILQAEQRAKLALWDEMLGALSYSVENCHQCFGRGVNATPDGEDANCSYCEVARLVLLKARALEGGKA